jgi:uncharacterized protein (TIGR00369 family)
MSVWKHAVSMEMLQAITLGGHLSKTMVGNLGIRYTAFGPNWLEGTMPVDEKTIQPYGILHGGASVVLAETLGSYASYLAVEENKMCVGVDINATHIRSVKAGSSVTGRATALKLGGRLHIWEIKLHETGKEELGPTCVSRLSVMITDTSKKPITA